MKRYSLVLPALAALILSTRAALAADDPVMDAMDENTFHATGDKVHIEPVEGKVGKALKLSFDNDGKGNFATGRARGNPDWDKAAGFSFWVKGDGSDHLGGIEFIWNEDYGMRYGYAFPINSTEWKKIVVPWHDLIPELGGIAKRIDARDGNAPSKLGPIWFGKWWYWEDYAAHSYAIDDIRLEPVLETTTKDYRPAGAPLARVLAKLKAGQPVTVVTMGDSLTDYDHWSNKTSNWPTALKTKLKQKYGADATIVNPAMGGTELRQNLIVMPRWTTKYPAPDLVTILFGFNDYAAGMRGPGFLEAQKDAVERIRRATNGQADVLILTPCPTLNNGDTFSELAEACRQAAQQENAGLADTYAAFQADPAAKAQLIAWDKTHLAPPGHELVANTILAALEKGGR